MIRIGSKTSPTMLEKLGKVEEPSNWNRAWCRFVELYGPIVYRLAKKRGLSQDEADNLVQEFLVTCVEKLPNFEYDPQRGRFRNWVITVALNLIRRHFRHSRLGQGRAQVDVNDIADQVPDQEVEAVGQWVEGVENARLIHMAFEELRGEIPSDQYEVMEMIRAGRKPKEIAEAMGRDRNWVDGVKFRNLQKLRAKATTLGCECFGG